MGVTGGKIGNTRKFSERFRIAKHFGIASVHFGKCSLNFTK